MALIPRYEDANAIWSSHSKALIVYMDASFLYDSFVLILVYFNLWQTLGLRVFTRFCFGPYNFFFLGIASYHLGLGCLGTSTLNS